MAGRASPRELGTLLALCEIEDMSHRQARLGGVLAGKSRHDDTVDVTVVEEAIRRRDVIVTSNPTHIRSIADAERVRLVVETV